MNSGGCMGAQPPASIPLRPLPRLWLSRPRPASEAGNRSVHLAAAPCSSASVGVLPPRTPRDTPEVVSL
jgi:hypothetical protein